MSGFISKIVGLLLLYIKIYRSNADDAVQGNNATLTCPFTTRYWQQAVNGNQWKQLTNDEKYYIDNISKLTIRNVNVIDSGYCVCQDCCQDKVTFLNVIVYESQGATVVWACPYTGTNYQWQRYISNNWMTLTSSDKYGTPNALRITIRNLDVYDSGQYQCNVNSETSNRIILNVTALLTVNILNKKYLAIIGGNVTLDCTVTGLPAAFDIWWTDGQGTRLNGNRYVGGSLLDPSLMIKTVIASDNGSYTCHGTNTAGTNNQSTQLEAGYIPQAKVAREHYISTKGNNVTIECTVTNADAVYWYKDNIILNVGSIQNPHLLINNVSLTDRGGYTCLVSNKFGQQSDVTSLKVVYSAFPNSNYEKKANDSVTLQCVIYDASELIWRLNGVYINIRSGRYSGGNITVPSLTVIQLTRYDTGIYQCESLLESVSSVSSDIVLKIQDKPLVNAFQEKVVAVIGENTIIQCSFDSYPEPTGVSWMKDDNMLIVKDGEKYNGSTVMIPSLTIYNVDYTDSGIYVCYVENSLGKSFGKSVKLDVQVAEPLTSISIVGPVAGGVFGGIVAVVLVVVTLFVYTKRKRANNKQNHNYETQDMANVELHLYDETQRSHSTDTKSPVYINTSEELTSSQIDMNTMITTYNARDFIRILQDKSSLSQQIRKEYEVLGSKPILRESSDYEIFNIKTGATIAVENITKAVIKEHDDGSGYILTTVPYQSQIDDFWTMITNYHVGYIVLLLQGVETISEFFPNTIEPINTPSFEVEICSFEKVQNNICEFVLDISNKEKETVMQVKLYKTTNWKVEQIHPYIDTMCKLLNVLSRKEPGLVALIGNNGVGFPVCGALGVCHEVVHAIHIEHSFSILQIAVRLKKIRQELFQTFEEYDLCYRVIDNFLQKEHTYAVID